MGILKWTITEHFAFIFCNFKNISSCIITCNILSHSCLETLSWPRFMKSLSWKGPQMSLGHTCRGTSYKNPYDGPVSPTGTGLTGMNGFIHSFIQHLLHAYSVSVLLLALMKPEWESQDHSGDYSLTREKMAMKPKSMFRAQKVTRPELRW